MEDIRECSCCRKKVARTDMLYTKDCHGIIMRLVCMDCYRRIMEKGYDGVYYGSDVECLEEDY